eukprot:scaffold2879_cov269-Prasinococcus_capsulatus_cf.AAC.41
MPGLCSRSGARRALLIVLQETALLVPECTLVRGQSAPAACAQAYTGRTIESREKPSAEQYQSRVASGSKYAEPSTAMDGLHLIMAARTVGECCTQPEAIHGR